MTINDVMISIVKAEKMGTMSFIVFSLMFFVGFIGVLFGIVEQTRNTYQQLAYYTWSIQFVILSVLFLLAVVPAITAAKKIIRSNNPTKSVVWRRLIASNHADAFAKTVDNEINDISTLIHHDDTFRFLRFWLTPNWIILVSARGSLIRRRCELTRVRTFFSLISRNTGPGDFGHLHPYFRNDTRIPLISRGAESADTECLHLYFNDDTKFVTRLRYG